MGGKADTQVALTPVISVLVCLEDGRNADPLGTAFPPPLKSIDAGLCPLGDLSRGEGRDQP
jgi:hypothetical protein